MANCVRNILAPNVDAIWDDYDSAVVSVREGQCGKYVAQTRPHGYLCPHHMGEQLRSRTPPPRKPIRNYIKHPEMLLSEDAYMRRILRIEAEAIAAAKDQGKIRTIRFGRYEPLELKLIA